MAAQEEKVYAIIAWLIPIVGPVVSLILKPGVRYVKHWSILSISFLIVAILGYAVIGILDLILSIIHLGLIGKVLTTLFAILVLIAWVVGILKAAEGEYWKPPLIYDIALKLGLE
ncbi:MAG: DUF4870 domain-containing protein [Thermogladius sp.]|jgi:uncharacterized membrane protein|nr:DUF4870 domain-containing protein [Thermogladius sp.]